MAPGAAPMSSTPTVTGPRGGHQPGVRGLSGGDFPRIGAVATGTEVRYPVRRSLDRCGADWIRSFAGAVGRRRRRVDRARRPDHFAAGRMARTCGPTAGGVGRREDHPAPAGPPRAVGPTARGTIGVSQQQTLAALKALAEAGVPARSAAARMIAKTPRPSCSTSRRCTRRAWSARRADAERPGHRRRTGQVQIRTLIGRRQAGSKRSVPAA